MTSVSSSLSTQSPRPLAVLFDVSAIVRAGAKLAIGNGDREISVEGLGVLVGASSAAGRYGSGLSEETGSSSCSVDGTGVLVGSTLPNSIWDSSRIISGVLVAAGVTTGSSSSSSSSDRDIGDGKVEEIDGIVTGDGSGAALRTGLCIGDDEGRGVVSLEDGREAR